MLKQFLLLLVGLKERLCKREISEDKLMGSDGRE